MKSYLNISLLIVSFILIPTLLLAQEVEVNLGGNTTSDAFVVRDTSGNVLLKMDGDQNFGINSEQPYGIEIKGKSPITAYQDGDPIKIIGGSGDHYGGIVSILGGTGYNGGSVSISSGYGENVGGDVDISTGAGQSGGGNINIYTHPYMGESAGNISIKTGTSNDEGGAITLTTGAANAGGNDISLITGGTNSNEDGNRINLKEFGIELIAGGYSSQGIILSPGGGLVQVIGSGTYTGSWTQASDKRYKSNIKPLSDLLNKAKLLEPVEYDWNKEEYPDKNFSDGKQLGLIAQNVEEIFPEIVATDKDGYKSIDYSKLSVILLQAMKEQQNVIDKQADEISDMKSDIEEIKSMLMQDSNKLTSN
jgi:Chaperone of endosialidase